MVQYSRWGWWYAGNIHELRDRVTGFECPTRSDQDSANSKASTTDISQTERKWYSMQVYNDSAKNSFEIKHSKK